MPAKGNRRPSRCGGHHRQTAAQPTFPDHLINVNGRSPLQEPFFTLNQKVTHRLTLYLLDDMKRRVFLRKSGDPPYQGKFLPLTLPLSQTADPETTLRDLIKKNLGADIEFLFHDPAKPAVLDAYTLRQSGPLFTQIASYDGKNQWVDFVYVAFIQKNVNLEGKTSIGWFHAEDLIGAFAPRHVKRLVKHILDLFCTP